MVILNISAKNFFISTLLGVVPYDVIYSLAGSQLRKFIDKREFITISDILKYENFLKKPIIIFRQKKTKLKLSF